MSKRMGATFAPVGDTIDNGYELGGSRIYPFNAGLAIEPPAYYSDYIGPANSLPVSVPAGSLPSTIGASNTASSHAAIAQAAANPWGRTSPLPWLLAALGGGIAAMYVIHYKEKEG